MSKAYHDYVNFGYFMLVLLLLSTIAFAPGYFTVINQELPLFMHVHAGLMYGWMLLLISQPLLIKSKNFRIHRQIGKISYLLVPILLISSYRMFQYAYQRDLSALTLQATNSGGAISVDEAALQASTNMALGFYYFIGLIIFYSIGVFNHRNRTHHAKYMISTSLMVTGPIIDRILFFLADTLRISPFFPLEYVAFFIMDTVMMWLFYRDWKRDESMRTTSICFSILFAGQLLYHLGRGSDLWRKIVEWLL